MQDVIFIKGLKADTIIGIYDWEKKIRQDIVLDLKIAVDIKKASMLDDIEHTLNYKSISKKLVKYIKESKIELVETLAENICNVVLAECNVKWVKLKLNKGKALSDADNVGVIIKRYKKTNIHVNIGSNINRDTNIKKALELLNKNFKNITTSSIYESEAIGFEGNAFYNIGVNIFTTKSCKKILKILNDIEKKMGRDKTKPKFSDRNIDLDLVLYGDMINKTLNIPRNDITKYAFTLAPIVELMPNKLHPKLQKTFKEIYSAMQSKEKQILKTLDISLIR